MYSEARPASVASSLDTTASFAYESFNDGDASGVESTRQKIERFMGITHDHLPTNRPSRSTDEPPMPELARHRPLGHDIKNRLADQPSEGRRSQKSPFPESDMPLNLSQRRRSQKENLSYLAGQDSEMISRRAGPASVYDFPQYACEAGSTRTSTFSAIISAFPAVPHSVTSTAHPGARFPVQDEVSSFGTSTPLFRKRDIRIPDPVALERLDSVVVGFAGDIEASKLDAYAIDNVVGRSADPASIATSRADAQLTPASISRPRSISHASVFSTALGSGRSVQLREIAYNQETSARLTGRGPEDPFLDRLTMEPRFSPAPPTPVPKDERYAIQAQLARQQRAETGAQLERSRMRTKSDAGLLKFFGARTKKKDKSGTARGSDDAASSSMHASHSRLALFGFRKSSQDA